MDAGIKRKWLKALRSGKYKKGRSFLRKKDRYCCLGVLMDIVCPEQWRRAETEFEIYTVCSNGETDFPSKYQLKKIGLSFPYAEQLAKHNDRGWSFARIADKIERDL